MVSPAINMAPNSVTNINHQTESSDGPHAMLAEFVWVLKPAARMHERPHRNLR